MNTLNVKIDAGSTCHLRFPNVADYLGYNMSSTNFEENPEVMIIGHNLAVSVLTVTEVRTVFLYF